jgi:excinuclease UvrABC ATPase subunit
MPTGSSTSRGGEVMFEGTPNELLTAKDSHTAEYLRR